MYQMFICLQIGDTLEIRDGIIYLRVPYIQLDPTAILSMQEPVPTVVELQPATAMTIKPAKTPVMASTSNSHLFFLSSCLSSPPILHVGNMLFIFTPSPSSFPSSPTLPHTPPHLPHPTLPLLPHSPSHSTTPHPPPPPPLHHTPPSSPDSRGDMSEEQLGTATVHPPLYHQPRRRPSVPLQGKFPLFCLLPPSPSIG